MPWEDPDDVRNKINRYITQQGAETESERDALSVAVREYVKYDRAEHANVAACTQVYNNVTNSYDDQLSLRCADLVAKLPVMPVTAIIGLRSFSTGVWWLLGQVELLEQHLESRTTLEPHQRLLAIALCGRNRRDLFTDPLVKQWNLDYLSGLKGPGVLSAAQVVELFADDRPAGMPHNEFEWLLGGWLKELESIDQGRAMLRQNLAALRADLLKRLAEVNEREVVDRALAFEKARQSVNDECMKYRRYMTESARGNQAAMRQFHQLKLFRLKYGGPPAAAEEEEDSGPPAADSPPQATPAAGAENPSHTEPFIGQRNEAGAAQVAGGSAGKSESASFSTVDFAIGRPPGKPIPGTEGVARPDRAGAGGSEVLRE
jgi:hypothetical protein